MSYVVRCDCGLAYYVCLELTDRLVWRGNGWKLAGGYQPSAARKYALRFATREEALAAFAKHGCPGCKPVVEEVPE